MQMHKYHCLNPIAAVGLDLFSEGGRLKGCGGSACEKRRNA